MAVTKKSRAATVLSSIFFLSLCLTALALVILLATFLPPTPEDSRDITVPALTGGIYTETDERLPADLYSVTVEYRTDEQAPEGTILSQTPAAGAVRRVVPGERRCTLRLVVSAGAPTLTLPDFVGQSALTAEMKLHEYGIAVVRQARRTDAFSPGQVIEMSPAAGSLLHAGDTVTLVESTTSTRRTLTVPDVTGMEEAAALSRLRSSGLTTTPSVYAQSHLPFGTVIAQFPLSSTFVTSSTRATLTLSDGSLPPVSSEGTETEPPEQMPQAESTPSEPMPGSPQGEAEHPDAASQYEDEISPSQQNEKKSKWFGWLF